MPKRRFGVALLVPSPLDHEIDGLRRALGDPALDRIPAHLTLVPPLNVNDERVDDAMTVLRKASAAVEPFELALGPAGTFMPDNPVVYLDVGGEVDALHALRDAVFVEPLARPLTWPFVPHVTIADELPSERIEAALVALSSYRVRLTFEWLHLLEEQPGRTWSPVAEAPLGVYTRRSGFSTP